jgi:hypothetical protein
MMHRSSLRAQTNRPEDAWPVRILLGGEDSPAAFFPRSALTALLAELPENSFPHRHTPVGMEPIGMLVPPGRVLAVAAQPTP